MNDLAPPLFVPVSADALEVSIAQTDMDLAAGARLRQAAYARHVPAFAQTLSEPEEEDFMSDTLVLQVKSQGETVGTMRMQHNRERPLALEHDLALPKDMPPKGLAEAVRLAVAQGEGRTKEVTNLLFKAFYFYCLAHQLQYMVVTARKPVDRLYEKLLFRDVYPELGYIPLQHVGGLPHRIMTLDVFDALSLWTHKAHSLLPFVYNLSHPSLNRVFPNAARQVYGSTC